MTITFKAEICHYVGYPEFKYVTEQGTVEIAIDDRGTLYIKEVKDKDGDKIT